MVQLKEPGISNAMSLQYRINSDFAVQAFSIAHKKHPSFLSRSTLLGGPSSHVYHQARGDSKPERVAECMQLRMEICAVCSRLLYVSPEAIICILGAVQLHVHPKKLTTDRLLEIRLGAQDHASKRNNRHPLVCDARRFLFHTLRLLMAFMGLVGLVWYA